MRLSEIKPGEYEFYQARYCYQNAEHIFYVCVSYNVKANMAIYSTLKQIMGNRQVDSKLEVKLIPFWKLQSQLIGHSDQVYLAATPAQSLEPVRLKI